LEYYSRYACDTGEVVGKKVIVRNLDTKLFLQEPEQFYHPHRIDVSVLEQVDFTTELRIGRADVELSADELLDVTLYGLVMH